MDKKEILKQIGKNIQKIRQEKAIHKKHFLNSWAVHGVMLPKWNLAF